MSVFGDIVRESRYVDNKIYVSFDEENYRRLELKLKTQEQEIERLNNIINELNYGIKELDYMFYETFRISHQNGYYSISEWELKDFTDKLEELKGVDKE